MTLIYNANRDENKAQTHVLIVGVGKYTHLIGGSLPLNNPMGMRQLTSPPNSARNFANWMKQSYNNPISPLGTIELLISENNNPSKAQQQNSEAITIEPATLSNVKEAFERWTQKCHKNQNNVAIFYFCGHGIEKDNLALLLEDFGENLNNPFENAINFEANQLGMFTHCQAQTQLYFIDACRDRRDRKVSRLGGELGTCFTRGEVHRECQNHLTILAAESGQIAYGRANQSTLFTEALILCLDGLGCYFYDQEQIVEKLKNEFNNRYQDSLIEQMINANTDYSNGAWVLDICDLLKAVQETVKRLASRDPKFSSRQIPIPTVLRQKGEKIIHLRTAPIEIPMVISVSPSAAQEYADLFLINSHLPSYHRSPNRESWKENIRATIYSLEANFTLNNYSNHKEHWGSCQQRLYEQPKKKTIKVIPIITRS